MRIVAITHAETSKGGLIPGWLRDAGHEVTDWSFRETGEEPPANSFDAIVVFGGGMNIGEEDIYPWLATEQDFIRRYVGSSTPMLGICLGAQMMALALDAEVTKLPEPEFGWHQVELTAAGIRDPLLSSFPEQFKALQWHRYSFAIPDRCEALATSALCNQAFRAGEHQWGVQFHPEAGIEQAGVWLTKDSLVPGQGYLHETGRTLEEVRADIEANVAEWNKLCERACRRWATLGEARVNRPAAIARLRPALVTG